MSVFGWLNPKYIGYSIYLGGGAGVGGHTLINTLLRYISPSIIATSLLMEPLIGSLIGKFLGVQDQPGVWTWVGGLVLIGGLVVVVFGEAGKEEEEKEVGGEKRIKGEETMDEGIL